MGVLEPAGFTIMLWVDSFNCPDGDGDREGDPAGDDCRWMDPGGDDRLALEERLPWTSDMAMLN